MRVRGKHTGFAIAIAWPETWCKQAGSWYDGIIGLLGISKHSYYKVGHAALVFDRRLEFEGKNYLLDFGVSGMLRNSDLVMWDRQTESWWQQLLGEALVGELTGAQLEIILLLRGLLFTRTV